jgi:hypothetical protein
VEELVRRIERAEEATGRFANVSLEDWAFLCETILPEAYGTPPSPPSQEWRAGAGHAHKVGLLVLRNQAQLSLWHAADPEIQPQFDDLLVAIYAKPEKAKEYRRLKAAQRTPAPVKPKRNPMDEKELRNWHQGMIRFEGTLDEEMGREYDPCEWKRRGDETEDGEVNARRRRCVAR